MGKDRRLKRERREEREKSSRKGVVDELKEFKEFVYSVPLQEVTSTPTIIEVKVPDDADATEIVLGRA